MDLIAIARLVRTRGLRGELVAELLTDFPERFENLKKVFAVDKNGKTKELEIENFWFQKGRVVLKFAGVDSIESAEALRNLEVCVPESEAVELGDDQFFDWQLEECVVRSVDGEKIGRVTGIMRTAGSEILVVEDATDASRDYLIPFVEKICIDVDIENRVIRIDPPEGLLGF